MEPISQLVKQEISALIEAQALQCSIEQFKSKTNWNKTSKKHALSMSFIRTFQNNVNWEHISHYQKLSEDFIREFRDRVDWTYVSQYQKLSEAFVNEHERYVNWFCIKKYQNYKGFIVDANGNKIPYTCFSCGKQLDSASIEEEIHNYIGKIFVCFPKGHKMISDNKHINNRINMPTDSFRDNYEAVKSVQGYVCNECSEFAIRKERKESMYSGLIGIVIVIPVFILIGYFALKFIYTFDERIRVRFAPLLGVFILPGLGILWELLKKISGAHVNHAWALDSVILDTFKRTKKDFIEEKSDQLADMKLYTWHEIDKQR